MDNNKKSVLKEALIDFREFNEAAKASAAEKLSKEFPDKFNAYLKEELNKTKHKESENDDNKDSKTLDENVEEKNNDNMKKEINEQKEVEKTTKKTVNESYEDFDPEETTRMEQDDVLSDHGFGDDFSMDDIEKEIAMMEELETELQENNDTKWTHKDSSSPSFGSKDGIAFKDKLKKMKNTINELLGENEEEINEYWFPGDEYTKIDSEDDEEISDDGETSDDEEILTDADIDEVLGEMDSDYDFDGFEDDVYEGQGITHPRRKQVSGKLPRKGQGLPKSHEKRLRYAVQESEKIIKSLVENNKKTTKSLNKNRKKAKVLAELVEGYKGALEKYRDQIKDILVFNTNLAHVNNLLVNEELALTQKDKVNIIKEFKSINSIKESEEKYNKFLTEMKTSEKKQIKENLDEKFSKSSSIQNSSKKVLDEVIEKTAYESNDHLNKIKKLTEYIENRRK